MVPYMEPYKVKIRDIFIWSSLFTEREPQNRDSNLSWPRLITEVDIMTSESVLTYHS